MRYSTTFEHRYIFAPIAVYLSPNFPVYFGFGFSCDCQKSTLRPSKSCYFCVKSFENVQECTGTSKNSGTFSTFFTYFRKFRYFRLRFWKFLTVENTGLIPDNFRPSKVGQCRNTGKVERPKMFGKCTALIHMHRKLFIVYTWKWV